MVSVPAGVVFSYNGFTFGPHIKTKVTEEPVTSGDNRVVKYSKITISVTGWITQADADAMPGAVAGQPLDALMLSIRRKLQVHGKALRYVNKGYGVDLTINATGVFSAGSQRDVAFGPKVGRFSFQSLGGAPDGCHGALFEWEVSCHIAECSKFAFGPGVFLEVSFAVTYDTDEAGLLTRTTSGTAQIPMSLRANNTIERTVDDEILRIIAPPPVGFLRRMSRQISPDRANCSFTLTDRQLEIPFPDDVVSMDMKYKVKQEGANIAVPNWACSLTGSVRLSPSADKFLAWNRFMNIAAQRMASIVNHPGANSSQLHGNPPTRIWKVAVGDLILTGTEFEEDLFSNNSRFGIHFRIIGAPFDTIMRLSGLWRPIVPAANPPMAGQWTASTWATSLANNAQAPMGLSGAQFGAKEDLIIDVCVGPPPPRPRQTVAGWREDDATDRDLEDVELDELYNSGKVGPTWLAWECTPERFVNHRQVRHKPLAGTVKTKKPDNDPFQEGVGDTAIAPTSGWTATVPDTFQQVASPSLTLKLTGFGVRLVGRVNPPYVISYGGRPVVLQHERVRESVKGITGKAKMYRTDWELIYLVAGPTDTVPLPANPFLGILGE